VKKGRFYVHMLDIPVTNRSDVEEAAEGFKAGGGRGGFVVVYKVALREAFNDISYFVPGYLALIVAFSLANELALERTLTLGDLRARYEHEDIEVRKAAKFIAGSSDPIFAFWRLESIRPGRIISTLESGVSVSNGKGREYFVNREGRIWHFEGARYEAVGFTYGFKFGKECRDLRVKVVSNECKVASGLFVGEASRSTEWDTGGWGQWSGRRGQGRRGGEMWEWLIDERWGRMA
jgi:hypothetical protein